MNNKSSMNLTSTRLAHLRRRISHHAAAHAHWLIAHRGKFHALPDFLVVGAMKSGTSSLFGSLVTHPDILGPNKKEIHFLDNPHYFRFGEAWYRRNFPTLKAMQAASHKLGYPAQTGEATPAMISNFYAINAGKLVPNAKIIMILRDPVERAYSHYHHAKRSFTGEPLSFWDALQAEEKRLKKDLRANEARPEAATSKLKRYSHTRRGMYIDQIEQWLHYFPREQLMIVSTQALKEDIVTLCEQAYQFLGLPPFKGDVRERRNEGGYSERMDERSREYLTELFRPYNRQLFEFLGEDWGWPS